MSKQDRWFGRIDPGQDAEDRIRELLGELTIVEKKVGDLRLSRVVLSADIFPPNTLGALYFPEEFEGRERPANLFALPLSVFGAGVANIPPNIPNSRKSLEEFGFTVNQTEPGRPVFDLLLMPAGALDLREAQSFGRRYLSKIAKPPEQTLAEVIVGQNLGANRILQQERETTLINQVHKLLSLLPEERERRTVAAHYNLDEYRVHERASLLAKFFRVSAERFRNLSHKGLNKLKAYNTREEPKLESLLENTITIRLP